MNTFESYRAFVQTVESGSITEAAESLFLAKSAVSRRISELEKHLGVELFHRTTRSLHLTDDGQQFYPRACAILDMVSESEGQFQPSDDTLTGRLNIALPVSFGLNQLGDILNAFTLRYPDLSVNYDFSDRKVNMIEEGFDVGLRIGKLTDSTLISKKIVSMNRWLVASPAYIKARGQPKNLSELQEHDLLHYSLIPLGYEFGLSGSSQKYQARLSSSSGNFLLQAAIAGQGIAMSPSFICAKALAKQQVVRILPEHPFEPLTLYAVYPQTRFLSRRARAFIDFIADSLQQASWEQQALELASISSVKEG